MRYRRTTSILLVSAIVLQCAGCVKWSDVSDPIQHSRKNDFWHVRVTLVDGQVTQLWAAEIVDDEIVGFTQRPPRARTEQANLERAKLPKASFSLGQIERLEESRTDIVLPVVVAGGALIVLGVFLAAGREGCRQPDSPVCF